jgi:anthranilate synthase/aminodeoxychorismate synthase-like glutamine amidotransferase
MILLIDNYDSFTFNLFQLIEKLGFSCRVIRNDEMSVSEIENLNPSHIVISPGPGRPEDAGITLELINKTNGRIPILGICLGHQAIGQAFGAEVVRAPAPRHGKQSSIQHRRTGTFAGLQSPMIVARYHSLILDRKSLPSCFQITSETEDGLIMGIRHQQLPIEGLQFHPESMATEQGPLLVKNFIERLAV